MDAANWRPGRHLKIQTAPSLPFSLFFPFFFLLSSFFWLFWPHQVAVDMSKYRVTDMVISRCHLPFTLIKKGNWKIWSKRSMVDGRWSIQAARSVGRICRRVDRRARRRGEGGGSTSLIVLVLHLVTFGRKPCYIISYVLGLGAYLSHDFESYSTLPWKEV